jgi:hypothetical protein
MSSRKSSAANIKKNLATKRAREELKEKEEQELKKKAEEEKNARQQRQERKYQEDEKRHSMTREAADRADQEAKLEGVDHQEHNGQDHQQYGSNQDNDDMNIDSESISYGSTPISVLNAIPPKYKKTNYIVWKTRMEAFLDARGLKNVITIPYIGEDVSRRTKSNGKFEVTTHDINNAFDENYKENIVQQMKMSYDILLRSLDSNTMLLIGDCTSGDAYAVWTRLEQINESKQHKRKLRLKTKLMNVKMLEKESVKKYAARLKQIVARLRQVGESMSDYDIKTILLKGLDHRKDYIVAKKIIKRNLDEMDIDDIVEELADSDEEGKLSEESFSSNTDGSSSDDEERRKKKKRKTSPSNMNAHANLLRSRGGFRGRGRRGFRGRYRFNNNKYNLKSEQTIKESNENARWSIQRQWKLAW